ncbi:MAG TPA: glycosyltransferase [Humisphaera sp.]
MSDHKKDILFVATADWDHPYWTNKQYVAEQLAALGHRVLYVESQGLRAPKASTRDLKRIAARLRRGSAPPRRVRENLWVWSPLVVPLQSFRAVRALNRGLLKLGVSLWSRVLRLQPTVIWTYSPMTTELYDVDRYDQLVYHAVDDIKAQPGMPASTIAAAEGRLSRRADTIFVTAPNLLEVHRRTNPNTHYFSNVCDFRHFNRAMAAETEVPTDLARLPGPRVGFVGAVSAYKLDFPLIRAVAAARPGWSFAFIGSVGEGDYATDVSAFADLPNVHFLGGRPYRALPGYLKGIDVAILPNRHNDYTRSMFPMKFFEYLAAGRPVVSTKLPALAEFGHVADLCDGPDEFLAAVDRAVLGKSAPLAARLAAARERTYEARTAKMLEVLRWN